MATYVEDVTFEEGFIVIKKDGAIASRTSLRDILTAADIPVLTIGSLELLTKLADWFEIIVKTLLEKGTIGEQLYVTWPLETILASLKDDLNTDIGD